MINSFFIFIVFVSIAGGCVSAVFLAAERYIYQYTSAKFAICLNTIVLLTFVVPYYKILSWLDQSSYMFTNYTHIVFAEKETMKDLVYHFIANTSIISSIVDIWLIGVIIYLIINICLYGKWLWGIHNKGQLLEDTAWLNLLEEVCREQEVSDTIIIASYSGIPQPCTTGITKKYILIPVFLLDSLDLYEMKMVLLHEVMHIKRRDVSLKIFITVLNSLHWFNPLFYSLRQNLNDWTEMGCDEDLMLYLSQEQRKSYMNVLFKLSEESIKRNQSYALYFGGRKVKNFKRRIYGIMKKQNQGRMACKIFASVIAFTVISGASVIAKAADGQVNNVFAKNIQVVDETEFLSLNDTSEYDEPYYDNIIDISEVKFIGEGIETRHQHKFVDEKYKDHKKNKDGSCKLTIYEGKRCTVCDKVLKGDIYSENTYKPCRHK